MLGALLGIGAIASVAYLYHWRERRLWFHTLPYFLLAGAIAAFAVGSGSPDYGFAAVLLIIVAGMHVAVWFELRKDASSTKK